MSSTEKHVVPDTVLLNNKGGIIVFTRFSLVSNLWHHTRRSKWHPFWETSPRQTVFHDRRCGNSLGRYLTRRSSGFDYLERTLWSVTVGTSLQNPTRKTPFLSPFFLKNPNCLSPTSISLKRSERGDCTTL